MRTEYGAIFRDRTERAQETERAVQQTERDPLAEAYASFRRRSRGDQDRPETNPEGDRE